MDEVEALRKRVNELEIITAMDKAWRDLKFADVTEDMIRDVADAPALRARITELEAWIKVQPKPWLRENSRTEANVHPNRLPGITVHMNEIDGLVTATFIQRRDGKFARPCPHCTEVYWQQIGDAFGPEMPEDCQRAMYEAAGCKWEDRNKQPWEREA